VVAHDHRKPLPTILRPPDCWHSQMCTRLAQGGNDKAAAAALVELRTAGCVPYYTIERA
jgi:hypothetical protein